MQTGRGTRAADHWPWWWVALAAVLPYLNAFGNAFVRDDAVIIRDNPRLGSVAGLAQCFTTNYWGEFAQAGLYRPLTLASFWLDHRLDQALGGLDTTLYTATNLALHAAVSVMLLKLVRALGASPFAAGAAALLFAVHPVHTEAVTGFVGRADLLSALFALLALLGWRRLGPGAGAGRRCAVGAAIVASMWSKEGGVALLVLLPLTDVIVSVPGRRRWLGADGLTLVLPVALALAARVVVLGGLLPETDPVDWTANPLATVPPVAMAWGELRGATPEQALLTPFVVVAEYARLLVWPARLSADYSFDAIALAAGPTDPRVAAGLGIVLLVVGGAVALRRRAPVACAGLVLAALAFAPVSNLARPIGVLCAERLLYLPSAGLLLVAAVGWGRLPRRGATVLLGLVLVAGAARTWARNPDWADALTLWERTVEAVPDSVVARTHAGVLSGRDALSSGAPGDPAVLARSAEHLEQALARSPGHEPALDALSALLWRLGRQDEAIPLYDRLTLVRPADPSPWFGGAAVLLARASAPGADRPALAQAVEVRLDRAAALAPGGADLPYYRGRVRLELFDDVTGARESFRVALERDPAHPQRGYMQGVLDGEG